MICRRRGVPGQPHDPLSHKIDVGPRPICCGKPASIVSRRFSLRGNKYSVLWRCTGECRKAFQGPSAVPPRPAATCPECGHKMVKQGTKNGNQRWCCRKAEGGCGVSRYLPKEEGGS